MSSYDVISDVHNLVRLLHVDKRPKKLGIRGTMANFIKIKSAIILVILIIIASFEKN